MARREYNIKINLNLSGTSFTDETHINVGASAFYLDHDWFFDDDSSGENLIIRTAAAGGGTLLVRDTDYTITNQDTYLTTETGKNTYSTVTVTNAAYQATTLYFSGKYVADSIDKEDVGRITWQYEAVSASATLAPTGYTTYGCLAGTNGIKLTLPAITTAYTNIKLEFIKRDNTDSAVTIDAGGSNINGLDSIFLIEQYQKVEMICIGTNWRITQGTLIADSGWINTNDETNRHFGTVEVDYDNLVGAFQIGENVTESGGETGIVMKDTGTTLTLWRVTDSGVFTNNNTLSGNLSGATADVDEAGTGSTKNQDTNFYHGFGVSFVNLQREAYLCLAASYTEANTVSIVSNDATNNRSVGYIGIDTNNFKLQTGASGIKIPADDGTYTTVSASDYMYRIIAKLII